MTHNMDMLIKLPGIVSGNRLSIRNCAIIIRREWGGGGGG